MGFVLISMIYQPLLVESNVTNRLNTENVKTTIAFMRWRRLTFENGTSLPLCLSHFLAPKVVPWQVLVVMIYRLAQNGYGTIHPFCSILFVYTNSYGSSLAHFQKFPAVTFVTPFLYVSVMFRTLVMSA